jgi:hypothetical protein
VAEAGRLVASRRRPGHPLVAALIAATGPGAQARVDEEVPRWGAQAGQGIGVAGDADVIAAGVLEFAAAGATSVCIQPTEDEPDLEGLIRFLGDAVVPLLGRPSPASG